MPRKAGRCDGCGKTSAHVVPREPGNPKAGNTWLCGSCELLRSEPWQQTQERPGRKTAQAEQLFPTGEAAKVRAPRRRQD